MIEDEELLPGEAELRRAAIAYFRVACESDPHFHALIAGLNKLEFDSRVHHADAPVGEGRRD